MKVIIKLMLFYNGRFIIITVGHIIKSSVNIKCVWIMIKCLFDTFACADFYLFYIYAMADVRFTQSCHLNRDNKEKSTLWQP